jgi:membrane fusion protein (multidrug efflux system)
MPPAQVTYVTVVPTTVPVPYPFLGVSEASNSVDLKARVQGVLHDWRKNFAEGKPVKSGHTLFQIEPREFTVDIEIAEAKKAAAQARLDKAAIDVKRYREAGNNNSIVAGSELARAVAEEAQAKAEVNEQSAAIEAKKLTLGYTTIKAPFDGVIGRAQRDPGSLVDAAQNSLLGTVQQLDPLYIYFTVSEREYLQWWRDVQDKRVLLGPTGKAFVRITLLGGAEYPYDGEINFSDTRIDPQTGSARLRAVFPNPVVESFDGPEYFLKPGLSVKGRIIGWQRPNAIVVPQVAVIQSTSGASVYTVGPDGTAQVRPVVTGEWAGQNWVIESGLVPGDKVIVDGVMKVMPKAPVVAKERPPLPVPPVESATQPSTRPATGPTTAPK